MKKIAFITQSYRADIKECKLLCDSIDRFVPGVDHFIFVNDEDEALFASLNSQHRHVFPKKAAAPKGFIRIPWKIAGHHFHVSALSLPMREWILQQICKLAVFEVIGTEYYAVFHIDSEVVFMRPFNIIKWVHPDGRCMMFRLDNVDEPSHNDYCRAAEKLLRIPKGEENTWRYNRMCQPSCFVRYNTIQLLDTIKKNSIFRNWKLALSNTYRFSEYYLYNIFTDRQLNGKNHFYINYRPFPVVDISLTKDATELRNGINFAMRHPSAAGVCLQKRDRKTLSDSYLSADTISETIKALWNEAAN